MKAWVRFMKRVAGYVCCFSTRVSAQKSIEEKKKSGCIAERWKVLSGSDNWEGLLEPLDSDLRRYLIHYATMIEPAIEAFVNEPASKHVGLSRYSRRNLLAKSGVEKGNPFKYEVTKYFYSPSTIPVPDRTGYTVRAARSGTLLKESNWIGYVAVATDEGKVALGRREILVVWRGAQRLSEGIENWTFYFVNAPLIFGQDSDPLVHKGWYDMYTTINQDSQLNNQSARDQTEEMKAWVMFMKRVAGYVCCFTTRVSAQKSTEEKKKSGGTAERWKVLCGYPDESSGSDNWEGLLDPLDSDLRRYLIHYATMIEPAIEAFVNEPASKHVGLSRYARRNLLAKSGVEKGNPFKYEVTKYFYSPSTIPVPDRTGYTVRAARSGTLLKESNWIGYVAVATDEGKVALGRREILVVWRGAQRLSEGIENWTFYFVNAPLIFGQDSDPLVHKGWYDMYTTINQDSQLNNQSARDQIREEVARLVELYKDEEVSITVAGHSMGSSMATLNAIDLAVNPINNNKDIPITSFVLGSPKVGDENFKKAFSNQQNLRGLRVTDVNDAIPTTPDPSPKDGTQQPLIPYVEVGVGFVIEVAKSGYIRPEFPKGNCHDLMLYMHGIDGFQGSQGGFEAQGIFDIAKINKFQKVLKDEYHIPASWLKVKDKGMVQQDDGTYILDDHQPDEF